MTSKEMTCIVCPQGCKIKVEYENDKVLSVFGNTCKRGEKYAIKEIISPERTITSTVSAYTNDGKRILVPVKSDKSIPKGELMNAMKKINYAKATLPIKSGEIIISNFIVDGVNLISCKTIV